MSITKVYLYGYDEDFRTVAVPVRAILFGELAQRAVPVVQHYLSDLYHDAQWLAENLNGPGTFEFLVRPCGTNLSAKSDPALNSARIQVKIGEREPAVFYRVELTCERLGAWYATFTDIPLSEVAALAPLAELVAAP